jgi:hypothetical protein
MLGPCAGFACRHVWYRWLFMSREPQVSWVKVRFPCSGCIRGACTAGLGPTRAGSVGYGLAVSWASSARCMPPYPALAASLASRAASVVLVLMWCARHVSGSALRLISGFWSFSGLWRHGGLGTLRCVRPSVLGLGLSSPGAVLCFMPLFVMPCAMCGVMLLSASSALCALWGTRR